MTTNDNNRPPSANEITAELLIRLPKEFPHSFSWRNNTGAVKLDNRFVRFGLKGAPDVLSVILGCLFGIEIKVPGDTQTVHQQAWAHALTVAGGTYILAEHIGWLNGKPDIRETLERLKEACQ